MRKRSILFILAALSLCCPSFMTAQNRWNISSGGSISHCTTTMFEGGSRGWGGGAFLGAGYEINFTQHWSLNPQIEIDYINNGNIVKYKSWNAKYYDGWRDFWNLNIPVIASFRFPVSDSVKLRFGAGPRLMESLYGQKYKNGSETEKKRLSDSFIHRFNIAIQGEASVETGKHLSYLFRVSYPFAKENWMGETITLSLGVRYSF